MELHLVRALTANNFTQGVLHFGADATYTLEDEKRTVKVWGETRIPAGSYVLKLRTVGGMHGKYAAKYAWHKGMLWLQDVPGFDLVYIHVGNTTDDSAGCVLVGDTAAIEGTVQRSVKAYERVYKAVLAAMDKGEEVRITITDIR
jgi:hypothetical protein